MVNSMTGYGQASCLVNGISYTVEIRTVNNRHFKTHIRLPDTATFLESDIEKLLRENLHRGTVFYTLRLRNVSEKPMFDINEAALQLCLEKLSKVAARADIKYQVDITGLLALPGITEPVFFDEDIANRIKNTVLEVTGRALEQLNQMRAQEGASTADDLAQNCEAIKQKLQQIRSRSSLVLQQYHERLKDRAGMLLADAELELDPEALAKEVAIFAERSDISEEISRLDSHLAQFLRSCREDTYPGRKLDFIAQEILREANTIASKAADTGIIHCVLDIKSSTDRLKEQIQNVE